MGLTFLKPPNSHVTVTAASGQSMFIGPHLAPFWGCAGCRVANGIQRPLCRQCSSPRVLSIDDLANFVVAIIQAGGDVRITQGDSSHV